jgi:hypothetical protein
VKRVSSIHLNTKQIKIRDDSASNGYISRVEFKGYILFQVTLSDLNIGLQSYNDVFVFPQLYIIYPPGNFGEKQDLAVTILVVLL